MKPMCVSCGSIFYLNDSRVISIGSLVRCSICHFIFMVHRPSFAEEPIVEDTNIDQSILEDLYSIGPDIKAELAYDEISEEWDDFFAQGALSIEDFDEEVAEESDSNTVYSDCADLPDLSEYENMIDWGDNTD